MSSAPTPLLPLLDPAALHARLGDPSTLIIDVRHDLARPEAGRAAYASGHLPGAFFLHVDEDLSGPQRSADGRFRGRHPLPDPHVFAQRLAGVGVARETLLVAYDDSDGMFAARLWWLARWLGHQRVALLDGGLKAWRAAGLPLSTQTPQPSPVALATGLANAMPTIEAQTLHAALGSRRYRILDARAPERYRGETEPLDAKAGHIPGALNRWYKLNLRDDGTFKSIAELQREYEPLLAGADEVVHQCGSGVSACHNLFAMALAGFHPGTLYPGSWSEWSADRARPVATGATP